MTKTILKARYSVTPVQNTDLYEIGITPKSLIKLSLKMTFWSMLPSLLMLGAMFGAGTYLERADKKSNVEEHLPEN